MNDLNFRIYYKNLESLEFCNIADQYVPHLHLISKRSEVLKLNGESTRAGLISANDHTIIVLSSNIDHLKSSSKFQNETEFLKFLPQQLESIKKQQKAFQTERIQRLAHNIRSINAKCLQSFYSVFSQEAISLTENAIVGEINKKLSNDRYEIPKLLLRLHKNHLAVKTEFQAFENLYTEKPNLNKKRHKIHRVLMNVFYPFFSDFQEKNIKVNIHRSEEKANFDYDSIGVAFFHLFENAHKYTKPDSHLNIYIHTDDSQQKIVFQMHSLAINDSEIPHIFCEQWSSLLATSTGKAGNGLGMFIVKKLIEMNNGKISIEPNINSRREYSYNGLQIPYQENKIIIRLPK